MPLTLDDLPAFEPPYRLVGSVLIVVGWWHTSSVRHVRTSVCSGGGFFPWRFGVLILSTYSEPPAALPLRYHELIAARLASRGLSLRSAPFDMVLDAKIPVDLGRIHYGLPKRFDPTFHVRTTGGEGCGQGQDVMVQWCEHRSLVQRMGLPIRLLFVLGLWLFTRLVDVLGCGPPARRTRIVLRPDGLGRLVSVKTADFSGATLRPLLGVSFERMTTELGVPRTSR